MSTTNNTRGGSPLISVILCTYNRDKYIYNVLKSVAENDYPRDLYEIVLVNNNSTDNTEGECQRFQADYPDIAFRYCVETSQGLSYARNCGIRQSAGDLLVYVDDDATVNKEYLRTYADFFASHPKAVAAGGRILPVYETEEPAWMSHYTRQLITGRLYLGNTAREFPKGAFPGGGNACYRKSVFDTVGLFNVELGRKGNSLIGAEEKDLFLLTNDGRGLVVNSSLVALKTTRNTQGVSVLSLRGRKELAEILPAEDAHLADPSRYRAKAIPKAPVALTLADKGEEQLSLL